MANNRSQIYIDTVDNSSKILTDIEQNVTNLRKSLTNLNDESDNATNKNKGLTTSFSGLSSMISKNLGKLTLLAGAFIAVKSQVELLSDFMKGGLQLNIDEQAAQRGIAGILSSVYSLKKEGKDLLGVDKFNASLTLSEGIIKKLKMEALQTGASFKELIDAFQSAVGAGAAKGMNEKQVADIASIVANAGKAMGMDGGMVGQELRALLSGQITGDAAIGTSLGLGPNGANAKEYQEAMKKGGAEAFDFLMKRLEQFKNAGISQAETIGGVFDGIADTYSIFQQESTKSLGENLKGIKEVADSLFDNSAGTFSKDLDGIKALFLTIGEISGKELTEGFAVAVNLVKELSVWLINNQEYISLIVESWNQFKDITSNIFEGLGSIFSLLGSLVNTFVSLFFWSSQFEDKTKSTLTVFTVLVGALSAVNVGVALIVDTVNILADMFKLVLGGAVNIALGSINLMIIGMQKISEFAGFNDVADSLKATSEQLSKYKDEKVFDIVGADNLIANSKDKFQNLEKAMISGAQSIENVGKKSNDTLSKYLDEIKKSRDGIVKNIGITTGVIPKTSGGDGKFSSKITDNLLKSYEKELSAFKSSIDIKSKYNQLFYSNYKKNVVDFYMEKESLDKQMFDKEIANFNKQLAVLNDQRGRGSKEDQLSTENKITEAIQKKENAEAQYALKVQETVFAREKDFRELDKSIEDFKAKINDLQGFTFESKTIKLNLEIEDLKNKFQNVDEMSPLIKKYEELSKRQLEYDKNLRVISTEEQSLTLLRESGAITTIEFGKKMDEQIRQRIKLLEDEKKLIEGGPVSDESLNRIKEMNNEIAKLQQQTEATAKTLAKDLKSSTQSLFEDLMSGTKSWKNALMDFFNSIHANISKIVAKSLMEKVDGMGGGDLFGSLAKSITGFLGMATGGAMQGGNLYKINEVGQEIFVPSQNGYMLNASQAKQAVAGAMGGGGGGNTNISVNVKANDVQSFRNSRDQLAVTINSALTRAGRNQ